MVDYVELATVAQELILEFGRAMSVRKVTTAVPGDPDTPWVPGAESVADTAVNGVFLETKRSHITGEMIPEDRSLLLLSASELGAVVPIGKDRIVDGAKVWEVLRVETLKPGATALIYELQVK